MLLQCEFLYDITQTVRLTSGSRSGASRMRNAVTYRQAMPSALSTTLGHSPLSSNRGCWGYKLWPRAHIMAHGPTPDGTSCTDSYQQWLSTQQCPNMRRSKRKAYWNILRENSTVKQHSAKCASLFWGLPAARRMDCTSTSLSAVHIELR